MYTSKTDLLVVDVMLSLDRVPVIRESDILSNALEEMVRKHLGIACIVNAQTQLIGILTDGDFRRLLLCVQKPFSAFFVDDAVNHAVRSPSIVAPGDTLAHAVRLMDEKRIWDLPVVDASSVLVGVLHLHQAVKVLLGLTDS